MWGVLLGTAAANKAASVGVGLSVLLGTAGTAEMTGIGPTVRELVRDEIVSSDTTDGDEQLTTEDDALVLEVADSEEAEATNEEAIQTEEALTEEGEEDAAHPQNDREHFVTTADDAPGNLVWHQRNGVFHLRGTLVDDGDGLAVRTAGEDGSVVDLPIDVDEVEARIPGANGKPGEDAPTLEDLVGALVRAEGVCVDDSENAEPGDGCIVTALHVLGKAGLNDGEEAELSSDQSAVELDEGDADEAEDGDDDAGDSEDGDDQDDAKEGRGKPDHAGGPKHKD